MHNSIAMFSLKSFHALAGFEPGSSVLHADATATALSRQGTGFLVFGCVTQYILHTLVPFM
jgi:hypothetical protein